MKLPLLYGFAVALGVAGLTLLMFFAGLHNSPDKLQLGQWVGSIGGILISITAFALAMRDKRANFPADNNWGYGNAVGIGLLTALCGSVFGSVFAYLYFALVNPDMTDVLVEFQLTTLEKKGMSPSQIEAAEPIMRKWMTPAMMTLMQGVVGFFWAVLLVLLVAIFFRKRRLMRSTAAEPPPV